METELQQCHVLVGQASQKVEALERGIGSTNVALEAVEAARRTIETAIGSATQSQKTTMSYRRLERLKDECNSLAGAVHRVQVKYDRIAKTQAERDELVSTAAKKKIDSESATGEAHLLAEEDGLRKTQTKVRQMTRESGAVLEALRGQRATMTRTQKSVGGLLTSMGVSGQIIDQLERMDKTDRLIVGIGCSLLTLLMLYFWFR